MSEGQSPKIDDSLLFAIALSRNLNVLNLTSVDI